MLDQAGFRGIVEARMRGEAERLLEELDGRGRILVAERGDDGGSYGHVGVSWLERAA